MPLSLIVSGLPLRSTLLPTGTLIQPSLMQYSCTSLRSYIEADAYVMFKNGFVEIRAALVGGQVVGQLGAWEGVGHGQLNDLKNKAVPPGG